MNKTSSGASSQTEVVYVKHVRANGPAFVGGLREGFIYFVTQTKSENLSIYNLTGDRPITINNVSLLDKKYIDVISMIENRYVYILC